MRMCRQWVSAVILATITYLKGSIESYKFHLLLQYLCRFFECISPVVKGAYSDQFLDQVNVIMF